MSDMQRKVVIKREIINKKIKGSNWLRMSHFKRDPHNASSNSSK